MAAAGPSQIGKYHTVSGHGLSTRQSAAPRSDNAGKGDAFKYSGNGTTYRARFVGSEEVLDKTGDKVAQAVIARVRAACREAGGNKPKVLINLSLNGVKVADLKTKIWSVSVPIPRLTYITKDAEDNSVFCIIVSKKKGGFKLFVYKADNRITSQIVHSIRELFQIVYKMVQEKKLQKDTKSKSSADFTKKPANMQAVRATSDSRLLDPPPDYGGFASVDGLLQQPATAEVNSQTLYRADSGIYTVPDVKRSTAGVSSARNEYQVPTNKPAYPMNNYQVPSNIPAYPVQKQDAAANEWRDLNTELLDIAKELNMYAGNDSSTPEQQPVDKKPSFVDPFKDDFFNQPFTLEENPFDLSVQNSSVASNVSNPFEVESPDASLLSTGSSGGHAVGDDDPFTAFEFDEPSVAAPQPPTLPRQQPAIVSAQVVKRSNALPPPSSQPPTMPQQQQQQLSMGSTQRSSNNAPPKPPPASTSSENNKRLSQNWTTFNEHKNDPSSEPLYAVADKRSRRHSSVVSQTSTRDEVFQNSFVKTATINGSQQSSTTVAAATTQVAPLQPPPRSRNSRRSSASRPRSVYGDGKTMQNVPENRAVAKNSDAAKFDLSSIKAKSPASDISEFDPFMDIVGRKSHASVASVEECTYF